MNLTTPALDITIARMKREILADVAIGQVPSDCPDFRALHGHVDANYYGGFFEDALLDPLITQFGGPTATDGFPDGLLDYVNEAQAAMDAWIQQGGITHALSERAPTTQPDSTPSP